MDIQQLVKHKHLTLKRIDTHTMSILTVLVGKVVAEGDNHTHDLEPAIKRSSDAEAGVDPVRVLEDPYVGVTNTAKASVKVKKER